MDYKRNRRYFETINWIYVGIFTVLAAILLYVYILVGIVILLGLGVYIYFKLRDRPTDEDIDAVCLEHAQITFQEGYRKLGLDPADVNLIDPVMIHGPLLNEISYSPAIKRGKDQQVRSSNYEISIFYFNEKQVYVYNHSFSMIDNEQNELIGEYFYDDIISISTATTTTMYFDSNRKRDDFVALDSLKLSTLGTANIEFPVQDLEKVKGKIHRMKDLIRRKKT